MRLSGNVHGPVSSGPGLMIEFDVFSVCVSTCWCWLKGDHAAMCVVAILLLGLISKACTPACVFLMVTKKRGGGMAGKKTLMSRLAHKNHM